MSARSTRTVRKLSFSILSVYASGCLALFAGTTLETQAPSNSDENKNSRDLFSVESTFTFSSDFKDERFGHGDSWYNDFNYDHRFLITGNWYFRAGLEYERYDFDGTDNGLPDHLQAISGHVAVEYVVHDYACMGIELDPGAYFENNVTSDALDVPWKAFVTFPLKKDKIFGVIGLGGSLYQDPIVAPGGGVIWLLTDKLRLQAVVPKPALIYNPNADWEFRVTGELNYTSFRTDDVITPAGNFHLHNAVVQYSEDRAGAQAAYSGFKAFNIVAGGGYTLRRDFDFFRSNQSVKSDPAPYVRFLIEAKF